MKFAYVWSPAAVRCVHYFVGETELESLCIVYIDCSQEAGSKVEICSTAVAVWCGCWMMPSVMTK